MQPPVIVNDRSEAGRILGHAVPDGWTVTTCDGAAGAFRFLPAHPGSWEVHYAADAAARGIAARLAFDRMLAWWWKAHPDCSRLVGAIRHENMPARYLAARLGFTRQGTYPLAWPDGQQRETAIYQKDRPQ